MLADYVKFKKLFNVRRAACGVFLAKAKPGTTKSQATAAMNDLKKDGYTVQEHPAVDGSGIVHVATCPDMPLCNQMSTVGGRVRSIFRS
jgi:hypothetical protein